MTEKILITPRSFQTYKDIAYPLIQERGYEIIENTMNRTLSEAEIVQLAADEVVGMIIGIDPLPAAVLEKCKSLRAISKYGVGMDNIDLEKAASLGIQVQKAQGTNNISVAETAIALIFMLSRHIYPVVRSVKNGGWYRSIGCELTGKQLGLFGCGQIGREVAIRACGLQMKVTVFDPYFHDVAFLHQYGISRTEDPNDIVRYSDIVSLHVPANAETKGVVGKETLALMKSTALLINTSRGELVDEAALYDALSQKRIAGAA